MGNILLMYQWTARRHALAAATAALFFGVQGAVAGAGDPALKGALQNEHLGLFSAEDFRLSDGDCRDCATIPQALWYFKNEVIAVPIKGLPVSGFSTTTRGSDDVRAWAATDDARGLDYPGLVWLGAPDVLSEAAITEDGANLRMPDGSEMPFQPTPKIATNHAYYNASSKAFFEQRPLRLRGHMGTAKGQASFTARTIWPKDFVIGEQAPAAKPLSDKDNLAAYVKLQNGGAKNAYGSRLIWQRTPGAAGQWRGKAVLAIMLNGAQGDDDESLGGHFAVATGTLGAHGEWADWLVNNYYTLDAYGEKGILAASVPMDNYLGDLNSGQGFYRPSTMLVAVLSDARAAQAYQGGAQRMYNHYYRHDIDYDGALNNCTGLSMDVFNALGWNIPRRGATHPLMALAAYPYKALTGLSLKEGRKAYDYLTEEQIRLYPAVAFEAAGQDLLQLLNGGGERKLTDFEQHLQSDVEALMLVNIPQFPSSRAMGSAPVFSYDEYMARTPSRHADWKIIPVAPRPFPPELRDGLALKPVPRPLVPGPVAVVGSIALFLLGAAGAALWLKLRPRKKHRRLMPRKRSL